MTKIEKRTGMTDAECEHWDGYYTQNTFETGANLLTRGVKPGFARNTLLLSELDRDVAQYLSTRAETAQKSKAEVINDIVREKIAAAQ
jgi:hypothetical protein